MFLWPFLIRIIIWSFIKDLFKTEAFISICTLGENIPVLKLSRRLPESLGLETDKRFRVILMAEISLSVICTLSSLLRVCNAGKRHLNKNDQVCEEMKGTPWKTMPLLPPLIIIFFAHSFNLYCLQLCFWYQKCSENNIIMSILIF